MSTDTLLHWLLRTTLEGGALVLIVFGLRSALGSRLTPGWRVALWSVVALKLMLPASLPTIGIGSLWLSPSSARVTVTEGNSRLQSADNASKTISSLGNEGTRPWSLSTETGSSVSTLNASSAIADRGLEPTAAFLDRYAIIVGVWMLGAMTLFGVAIMRELRFRRLLARLPRNMDRRLTVLVHDTAHSLRLPRVPRILITEASTVPAVTGLFSPVLLMPRDWESQLDSTELDSILRHELLHLKHHDLWWNWCATLVHALHWFNPVVWFAVARCQEDRELRCDERALAIAEPSQRIAYGRVLLRLQEHFIAPPAIAGIAPCVRNHPPLRQRILMITQPASHRPWFHALCSLALGTLVIVSFGSARAQEEKPNRNRNREGERSPAREEEGKTRKGEADGMKKRGEGDGAARTGARDGDGAKKMGARDGEGATKTGARDGEGTRKTGARDGEGARKSAEGEGARKTGARDGEGTKKTGAKDGEGARKTGARDGEGSRKPAEGEGSRRSAEGEGAKRGARDGETASSGKELILHVTEQGETIVINGEKVPHSGLRGFLSEFLPQHAGDKVVIEADEDVPGKVVGDVLDAARDNGAKKAQMRTAGKDR